MYVGAAAPSRVERVLLVDADVGTRSLYEQSFTRVGFDVVPATDGRDALTKALVHPPSLVVTELQLPIIDGFALCEILRRDRATAHVPILVVAEAGEYGSELMRCLGAQDVLVKPLSADMLVKRARQLLADPGAVAAFGLGGSIDVHERLEQPRRRPLIKAHQRGLTTTPALKPPTLTCPTCDHALTYEVSHIGGVSERHPEQYDYFRCRSCGTFQYRHRTRKLKHLSDTDALWLDRPLTPGV